MPGPSWYGLPTLAVRLKAQEERAHEIARFLEGHPKVARVLYPGLPSFPQAQLAERQMRTPRAGSRRAR